MGDWAWALLASKAAVKSKAAISFMLRGPHRCLFFLLTLIAQV